MIRDERLAKITEYVHSRHFASVDELIKLLGVSKATVRRDLLMLSENGTITLTRGGATFEGGGEAREPAYNEKKYSNISEKNRIGEAAAKLIQPGHTIIIDAGTTTRAMIPFMTSLQHVNLVTNDVLIAADVNSYDGLNVTVTGGQMRHDFYTLRGYVAEDFVNHMKAAIAFVGFDAVDVTSGCYISNTDEVALKRCMIRAAEKVVALCDHTKFSNSAFISVCPLSEIDIMVTNRELDPAVVSQMEQKNVQVILA